MEEGTKRKAVKEQFLCLLGEAFGSCYMTYLLMAILTAKEAREI